MKIKRISIPKRPPAKCGGTSPVKEGSPDDREDVSILDPSQTAWVADEALTPEFLEAVDHFRVSLPLDTKRPTVKRRFFSSASECPAVREGLTTAIQEAVYLPKTPKANEGAGSSEEFAAPKTTLDSDNLDASLQDDASGNVRIFDAEGDNSRPDNQSNKVQVHVLAYMRFLEYDQVGGRLEPHTDGNKVCEDTGIQSTHTMLLYLRDCQSGGETVLFEKDNPPRLIEAVQPLRGRVLLFPHPTLHEGAPTVDVPKLCLRAEVALYCDN